MLTQIAPGAGRVVVTTLIQGLFTMLGIERLRDRLEEAFEDVNSVAWLDGIVCWDHDG